MERRWCVNNNHMYGHYHVLYYIIRGEGLIVDLAKTFSLAGMDSVMFSPQWWVLVLTEHYNTH